MATLAPSLARIRATLNECWPNRDKRSDGWIGDRAHAASKSDHNPDGKGMVHALDIDVDGIDVPAVVTALCQHPATRYVIYSRRIRQRSSGFAPREYTGPNPHTSHIHVSIEHTRAAEQAAVPLPLTHTLAAPLPPLVPAAGADWEKAALGLLPVLRSGANGRPVRRVQALLNLWGHGLVTDSDYGPATVAAVTKHQKANKLDVDGAVGPATWASLCPLPLPDLPHTPAAGTDPAAHRHEVRVCQALLTCFGYQVATDGEYGPLTDRAVRQYQTRFTLKSDGVVGRATWTNLWAR